MNLKIYDKSVRCLSRGLGNVVESAAASLGRGWMLRQQQVRGCSGMSEASSSGPKAGTEPRHSLTFPGMLKTAKVNESAKYIWQSYNY